MESPGTVFTCCMPRRNLSLAPWLASFLPLLLSGSLPFSLSCSLAVSLCCSVLLCFCFSIFLTGRNYTYHTRRETLQLFQKIRLIFSYFAYCHCKETHSYLSFATLGLLNLLSATANLHICKTFSLTYLGIDKSKYKTTKIYSNCGNILKHIMCKYHYTTNEILILKQIICNSH